MRLSTLTPIAIAIALSLTACGGGESDESTTTNNQPPVSSTIETPAANTPSDQTNPQTPDTQTPDTSTDNTTASNTPHTIPTISPQDATQVSELLGKDSRTSSYIITLNPSSTQSTSETASLTTSSLIKALNSNLVSTELSWTNALSAFQVSVPSSLSPQALSTLLSNPNILSIEPVQLVSIDSSDSLDTTPISPLAITSTTPRPVLDLWGLDRIDQTNLPLSYTFSTPLTGRGSNIYVVDTGILSTHSQLSGRVGIGANFTTLSGTTDCNGHGTHVASTSAGSTYGVAPEALVYPLRVLNCSGVGTSSAIIQALDWIYTNGKLPGTINLSIGTPASPAVNAAISKLFQKGFVISTAAGNASTDACSQSPASAPEALTVAASTPNDSRASYSNFGKCVDLFAPGSAIKGAIHSSSTAVAFKSGTSMASPHVAGVSALLQQAYRSGKPTQTWTFPRLMFPCCFNEPTLACQGWLSTALPLS